MIALLWVVLALLAHTFTSKNRYAPPPSSSAFIRGITGIAIAFLFVAVVTAAGVIAWMAPSSLAQDNKGQVTTQTGTKEAKQIIVTTIPRGYRDWKFISAAHEAGELNDIRVVIGNDKAIKAYRSGKPFPEGTIIGRVAWKMVPSEDNNKTFGQAQS